MAEQWYYTNKGKEMGPVSGEDIKRMAATGALRPTDMVWNQDMPNWARASTIPSLKFETGGVTAGKTAFRSETQEKPKTDPRPAREKRRYREEDEDDDDRPRRRRRPQAAGTPVGAVVGLVAGGVLVLVVVIVGLVLLFSKGSAPQKAAAVAVINPPAIPNAAGNPVIMTYTVDLQVQGVDIRPINLIAQRRYEIKLKAVNQAGDMDLFMMNQQGQNLAQDVGLAADAFIDFTAPYSGVFRIAASNAGLMQNQATITVTDLGVNPNPPQQVVPNPQLPKFPNGPKIGNAPNQPQGKLARDIKGDMFGFLQSAVKENRVADVDIKGVPIGTPYRDILQVGGLLIGFEVGFGKQGSNQTVNALRPIYLTQNGEMTGSWHGPVPANPTTVKAKAGYVVGAISIKSASHLDGLTLKFMKLGQGTIVTQDQYDSPWVGGKGHLPGTIGGQGYFFVGITGHLNRQNEVRSLGLVAVLEQK